MLYNRLQFSTLRPKYPIRKYVDILDIKSYNRLMERYESKILKNFEKLDVKSKEKAIGAFKKVWVSEKVYKEHLKKRIKVGHIKNEEEYFVKTIKCLSNAKECKIAIYNSKDTWDRIRYFDNEEWIVIFTENGEMITSHKKELTELSFEEKHKKYGAEIKKGDISDGFKSFFKFLQSKFGIF